MANNYIVCINGIHVNNLNSQQYYSVSCIKINDKIFNMTKDAILLSLKHQGIITCSQCMIMYLYETWLTFGLDGQSPECSTLLCWEINKLYQCPVVRKKSKKNIKTKYRQFNGSIVAEFTVDSVLRDNWAELSIFCNLTRKWPEVNNTLEAQWQQ